MKLLVWIVGFISIVWADGMCETELSTLENTLIKKYSKELKAYKKYNLDGRKSSAICSKENLSHEVVMLVPYVKMPNSDENTLSFLIAIIDKKNKQIKESYLHKDAIKASYISYLFEIDTEHYKKISNNRPFAIIVKDIFDGPPTSGISKLFLYKHNKLKPILSNLIIEAYDEEMADFIMERKATLQKLKGSPSYETLIFKDKYYYGVNPYAISSNAKSTKEFEWHVNLDDISCYYKAGKYTCNRKPVFNLDEIEANTKKGWRYRKIVLLAMLYEVALSKENINIYNNIAYNLRKGKHLDEAKFLSDILREKFPEKKGEFLLSKIRKKEKNLKGHPIMKRISTNQSLLDYDNTLEQMIQKFIAKMSRKDSEILIKEQKEWNIGREFCTLLDTEDNETINDCLIKQYRSRIDSLNKKLAVGEALNPMYRRLLEYYRNKTIDISQIDIKFSKPKLCNEDDKSYFRGLLIFYAYYYAFVSIQYGVDIESDNIESLNCGGYEFVEKLFDKVNEQQIYKYVKLGIDSLREEDVKDISNFLEKLSQSYILFNHNISVQFINNLKDKRYIRAEDIDINLLDKDTCLNNGFYATNILINQHKISHGGDITFNDFVYTFWFRRYNDGTLEKMKKLIDMMQEELGKRRDNA